MAGLGHDPSGQRSAMRRSGWRIPRYKRRRMGIERFPCPVCGASFINRSTLDEHIRREHGGSSPVTAGAR